MRVLDEVDEAPLQGLRGGFTTSQEEIQTTQNQVGIVETQLTVSFELSHRGGGTNMQPVSERVTLQLLFVDWLSVSTVLSPLSGRCRCSLEGCWGPGLTCASLSLP